MALPTFNVFPVAFGAVDPSPTLSADARYLAYASFIGGTRQANVFIHDTVTGAQHMVSSGAGSVVAGNDNYAPAMAAGGTALAFTSVGVDGVQRIDVASLASGSIAQASIAADGSAANGDSRFASISADGRYVAFESAASNLVANDVNGADDIFVKDMQTGAIRRVSVASNGAELDGNAGSAQISADGKMVMFHVQDALYASNLSSGALTLVSASSTGQAQLSADGRYVVFGVTDVSHVDIVRKDLASGAVQQVSVDAAAAHGAGWSGGPSISADGRHVSFSYDAGDLAGVASATSEVYVKDMQTGALQQLSHGADLGAGSFHAALSADGAHVAYATYAGLVGDNYDVSWNVTMATLAAETRSTTTSAAAPERVVTGGAGLDQLVYQGKLSDYAISIDAAGAHVADSVGARDGAASLTGIERLHFADTMLALDTIAPDGVAGQAYRVYQAAFNRAPDHAGLGYWIAAMDHGQSLQAVAKGFVQSAEFAALYGSAPTNAQVVDKLYLNVLHRAGEPGGVAYWNSVLDHHQADLAGVLASFSDSAENMAALVGVLEHGVAYTAFM